MRQPAARVKPRQSKPQTFPAPVGGWIANTNLAVPDARRADGSKVNGAAVLENFFPTATGLRFRGGSQVYTILDTFEDIVSLFTYSSGNNTKMFAATETAIFDISTSAGFGFIVDELGNKLVDELGNFIVDGMAASTLGSLTGGEWISVQFQTSGGVYLRLVNGADTPLVYDGSTFSTSPAITGVTPEDLSFVWAHAQRLFFVEKESLNAWYLSVDTLGGAATKLPLGGVFNRGGSLLFGATWSLDSGSGLGEYCVFVTTEGEVAVYQGTNPGDASAWSKVGVYRIGKPRGPKAMIRAGGDLVIATDIGFIPLSVAVQRDYAALAPSAISFPIETAWNSTVENRSFAGWHCEMWPTKQMVIVAPPTQTGSQPQALVTNARTGAWALYSGWDVTCVALYGDRFFFGSKDGEIFEAEVGGKDFETAYVGVCVPLFDPCKTPTMSKTGLLARATYRAPAPVEVKLTLQTDYDVSLPAAPNDISTLSSSVWGGGIWGTSVWSSPLPRRTHRDWRSVHGHGYAISVAVQVTSLSISAPDFEYVQTDLEYDMGDVLS